MDKPPALLLQLFASPRLLERGSGQALHIGSRKALVILAWLALEGSATRERLASLLWPEVDSASSRRNLRRELFRLRELGAPLQTAADGTLTLDACVQVDALALLRERRLPEQAGPALEGLDGVGSAELDAWLQRWRANLAQQRGQALATQADAHETEGALAAALGLHQQRLALDACHEDAALQVMRLQVALGDRSGALQTHQRLCEALREELDLQPGEPVQALARVLRRQLEPRRSPEPSPASAAVAIDAVAPSWPAAGASPAGAPASLPAVVPFIPRAHVQARIEAAWARRRRVYLHGVAGVGKTRLASELAAARGPWLRVACEPQDEAMPYASVVRLLRALRDAAPDVQLPAWVQRELAQLMPELGPPPEAPATDEARQRLRAALAEAWRLLVQDNFAVLVLDDWHWGDAASVAVWSQLDEGAAAAGGDGGVAWIISYRSAQLPAAALQRQRLDVDTGRGDLITLEGMGADDVLGLTRALSGSPGGRLFSRRLQAATDGNPFFLLETLRHLMAQQLLVADATGWSTPFDESTADYAELPVPASVRAAVQARVHALGTPMLRLLELACLCRGQFDARRLAGAAGQGEEAVIDTLAHAQAAQLVQDTPAGWRFAHDLVRQSLQQGLSAARQRLLQERLARQIEAEVAARGAAAAHADHAGVATDLALHWEAAQQPAAAVRWRIAAAEAAARVYALDECLAHYSQALADGAEGAEAVAIHLASARVQASRTDRTAADAALAAAGACAAWVAGRDPDTGPALVLRTQLARVDHLRSTDRQAEALALLDTLAPALAAAAPPQQAHALTSRGALLVSQGHLHDGLALFQQAVALIDTLPDARPQLAALLLEVARAHMRAGDLRACADWARRAIAAHEALDAASGLGHSLNLLAVMHLYLGEREQAQAALQRARSVARRAGDVAVHRGAILNLVKLHVDMGETEVARQLLDEGEALAPGFEHRRAEHFFLEARYFLHYLRGEAPQARAAADRLLAFGRGGSAPSDFIGICHLLADQPLLLGELAQARALLDEAQPLCDHLAAHGTGHQYGPQQAIKRAWLALAEGRPADTLALLPAPASLQRLEDRFGAAWLGAAAARALGDDAGARRRLDAVRLDDEVAVDQYAPWLQQLLLLTHREGGDPAPLLARARALLAEGRVPALFAAGLQRAVNAAATAGS